MTHRDLKVSPHPAPAHQFEDIEQEREANVLGMWVFLATEIMLFGTLFVAYASYSWVHREVFAEASRHLDLTLGSINTVVLLTSSLTMALAVRATMTNKPRSQVLFLGLTMLLGLVFVAIKFSEYLEKFHEGLIPGLAFHPPDESPQITALFFGFYFVMTGLHAVHMLIGVALLAFLAFFAWRGRFSSANYLPVEMGGLYWHFVDVVWIFIFPLMYLIGRA
jgi:cytochrome c oxidase subunit III